MMARAAERPLTPRQGKALGDLIAATAEYDAAARAHHRVTYGNPPLSPAEWERANKASAHAKTDAENKLHRAARALGRVLPASLRDMAGLGRGTAR